MKIRPILSLIVLVAVLFVSTGAVLSAPLDWQPVAPGIEYREYKLPDPVNVFVARMDRNNPNVTLESSIAMGKLASGRETVRNMASRYDQAINYWGGTWGNRNRVAVAINGYFFDPETGTPWRGQVQSGWFAKRFDDNHDSGFAWKLDRSAFIGECVYNTRSKQVVTKISTGNEQRFDGVNIARGSETFVVYTPQWDSDTNTDADPKAVEILVEMTRPASILPKPLMATGVVKEIRNGQGSTQIPFDHIVLSAHGAPRDKLFNYLNLQVGDEIGISQDITNCTFSPQFDWTETYASIGGSFYFLKDTNDDGVGEIQTFDNGQANVREARTAIAFNNDYIFFIVVDSWEPGVSIGMNMTQLGAFARDTLGATYGINQDGGGSSTIVVNGEVKNNTYCNLTHKCGTQTTSDEQYYQGLDGTSSSTPTDSFSPTWGESPEANEAFVANGMLMVVVEPKSQYTFHTEGEHLFMAQERNIRLGPGTNYDAIGSAPVDGDVAILPHALNGVQAKNLAWWKVQYGGMTGWMGFPLELPFSLSLPFVQSRVPVQQNAPAGPANPFIAPNGLWGGRR